MASAEDPAELRHGMTSYLGRPSEKEPPYSRSEMHISEKS